MRTTIACLLFFVSFQFTHLPSNAQDSTLRWPEKRAWDWYNKQPWLCGFNYIPAYAINYTAMWDKTSYDAKAIDKELKLAASTGMNVLRVVLQYAVYEQDPAYFLKTLDDFASISARNKIKVVPALFDDCVFGIEHDPKTGKQPEPLDGWYAWAWSPSPGHSMVVDHSTHKKLEEYVVAVISRFRNDERFLFWDLYNEPTNGGLGSASFPLLKKVIAAARTVNPSQPLSVGIFDRNKRLNDIAVAGSDIISFHNYDKKEDLVKHIRELKQFNRPLINTEWMNRDRKSTITDCLQVFYEEKVGCMLWGVVNGKTQTHLNWGHRPGDPEPKVWQHDLYHNDLSPYDAAEIRLLTETINKSRK